ncbi:hypothetical protein DRO55_03200, partial [Candidatus Bathyarchaeota archaeon]
MAGEPIGLYYQDGTKDILIEEALRIEGIPYLRLKGLGGLVESGLRGLIIGEEADVGRWLDEVERFLNGGGALLTFKPSGGLVEVLGITDTGGSQIDGYVNIRGGEASTLTSYKGRLQIFGLSRLYRGGEVIATLTPEEDFGGVLRVRKGLGVAIAVAFDMPRTILMLQQPDSDCGKALDTWRVEDGLERIPQLDLMRRLIFGLFLKAVGIPIPRKWYFPDGSMALLLIGGDQDGCGYDEMGVVLGLMRELGAPYTLFVTPWEQPMSREQLRRLVEAGVDMGFHPNFFKDGKKVWDGDGRRAVQTAGPYFKEEEFLRQLRRGEADIGGRFLGVRTHGLRWGTVKDLPIWMERAGLQYDSTLGHKCTEGSADVVGYSLGTGLPFYFIDPEVYRRIDVIEMPMLSSDYSLFRERHRYIVRIREGHEGRFYMGLGLSEDEAFNLARDILDDATDRYHTVNCYCWHPIYLASRALGRSHHPSDRFFSKLIKYAKDRGVRLMDHGGWNRYWRARETVEIRDVDWNPEAGTLRFLASCGEAVRGLTLIVSFSCGNWVKVSEVRVDGEPHKYRRVHVLGLDHA